MRKPWLIGLVAAVIVTGAVATNAAIRSRTTARETGPATGLIRSTRYWDVGPAATYDFDSGGISEVTALRLTFPAAATYDAVVTVTLDYKTSPPDDRFNASILVREGAEFGPAVHATPSQRPLRASTARSSVTLTFRLSGLTGGTEYWLRPFVNVPHRDSDQKASIDTRRVLMVVDATQAA